jgi:hypothetical protein
MSFFPSFLQSHNISDKENVQMAKVFFSLSVQIEERKSSKAPKDRFSKRTHFSGVRPACTSVVLL